MSASLDRARSAGVRARSVKFVLGRVKCGFFLRALSCVYTCICMSIRIRTYICKFYVCVYMYVYVYSNIECLCALLIKGVYVCVVQSLACF